MGNCSHLFFVRCHMHLSDDELKEVFCKGPEELSICDEYNRAHVHLVHEKCEECTARLLALVLLSMIMYEQEIVH